jgi:hypothetical protein
MPQNGVEEMEKRAEAVGSRWRVFALVSFGIVVAKMIVSKIAGLSGRKSSDDAPK